VNGALNIAALRVALFAVAFVIGAGAVREYRASGEVQEFYQPEFGPAVLLACGKGYRVPDTLRLPELAAFLRLERDSFDCASLPGDVPVLPEFTSFQRISRYLLMSVGTTWRLAGISWSRLVVFGGLLFAIVVSLTYGLVGLSLGPLLGLAAALPLLWSPLAFSVLPHFRDYAKAPFMLAMILAMALLVTGSGRPARVVWLSVLGGAIAGVGLGFRNDILLTIPPFVVVVCLLTPVHAARAWRVRVAALVAFAAAFGAMGAPVIADYSQGSNTSHVVLLGLMTPFDEPLGVQSAVYSVGGAYDDSLAYRTIDSFANRMEHRDVRLATDEYDRAGMALLSNIAAVTPADLATRVLAATRRVPGFVLREHISAPAWVQSRWLRRFYYARELVDVRLAQIAALAVAAALLVAAGQSIRHGVFVLLILAVFAGGAALQFQERHFFYLEFVPWWAFACLCRVAWSRSFTRDAVVRAGRFAAVCAAVTLLIVGAARAYQDRAVRALLDEYLKAPRRQVLADPVDHPRLVTTFVIAEVGGARCSADSVPVTIHGRSPRTVEARIDRRSPEPTHVLFADYQLEPEEYAVGVTVPADDERCLTQVASIDASTFPVLLEATLAPGWRDARLHQRLTSLWK
jgi:hypothetical protein